LGLDPYDPIAPASGKDRMPRRPLPSLIAAAFALVLIAACGGGSDDDPTATPGPGGDGGAIATATPFASLPAPLILDASDTPEDGGGSSQQVTYVVVAGDSLSLIAERFDTTVDDIMTLNALDSADIFIGQQLLIPGDDGATTAPATATRPPTTGGVDTYVVQPGDTGFGIALELNVTLEALAAANGLTVDDLTNLQIGQELLIPTSE
jgi:LysM repeat protein